MLGDVVHVIVRAMLGVKLVALSRLVILVRRACGLGSTRVCSTLLHQLERSAVVVDMLRCYIYSACLRPITYVHINLHK